MLLKILLSIPVILATLLYVFIEIIRNASKQIADIKIRPADGEENSFINRDFILEAQNSLIINGFSLKGKYIIENAGTQKSYTEHYVKEDEGMIAFLSHVLNETKIELKDDKTIINNAQLVNFSIDTYFEDGTLLESSSGAKSDFTKDSENDIIFRYPSLSPEEIILKHKNHLRELVNIKKIDFSYLNRVFSALIIEGNQKFYDTQVKYNVMTFDRESNSYLFTRTSILKILLSQFKKSSSSNNKEINEEEQNQKYAQLYKGNVESKVVKEKYRFLLFLKSIFLIVSMLGFVYLSRLNENTTSASFIFRVSTAFLGLTGYIILTIVYRKLNPKD